VPAAIDDQIDPLTAVFSRKETIGVTVVAAATRVSERLRRTK
jgi:hypothetical protein